MAQPGRSAPNAAPHENIRLMVAELFKHLYRSVVHRWVEVSGRKEFTLLEYLLETPEFLPLIIPQEIYAVDGSGMRVDMAFGRSVVLELKSDVSEFDKARQDALNKYLPSPHLAKAKYFIVTNYEYWRIYRVNRIDDKVELIPIVVDRSVNEVKPILRSEILPEVEPKLPAHPDVLRRLFEIGRERLIAGIKNVLNRVKEDPKVKPLYEAYKKIMEMLYGSAPEAFFEDLFAKHTLMHMIVLAGLTKALGREGDPADVCSGMLLDIDVALPYLNWWRVIYIDPSYGTLREEIRGVAEEVVLRVNLIDWTYAEAEDVFRALYELLVDPDTRKRLGEYYTPLWIAEYILDRFELKGRIVLDPFCGSGTFLVVAFHKKVGMGEDADEAYSNVVGFDINPLAVAIARAELLLAYVRRKGVVPEAPPRVYHTDTLAMWFGGRVTGVPEIEELFGSARKYIAQLINFNIVKLNNIRKALDALSKIESGLAKALRYAYHECRLDKDCLERSIDKYLTDVLGSVEDALIRAFLEHVKKNGLARKLAQLIVKYGGNSVWGLVLTSVYVPSVLSHLRVDIIASNPPWIPTTEFKAPYAGNIREELASLVKSKLPQARNKAAQIVAGSDIATAALAKALTIAREGVAFVMNREQSFYHRSPMPAGIVATYAILKGWDGDLELIDIDYDAFQHNIYPALIIARRRAS